MAGENSLGYSSSGTHLVRFLREIPEFSGAMSVQQGGRSVFNNPLSWLKQLSRLQELAGIGDKEALLIARDHLTGKAEKWYDRSCSNVKTWSEFTTRFKEKFCSGHEDYWWAEIANTKQGSDEDVEDVDIKLRELFSLVGVTDEKLKIRSFMDAINPAVAWEVERSEDMTKLTKMEDVVNAAVRAEGVIKKYRSKGVAIVGPPVVRQNQEVLDYDSNTFGDNRSVKSSSTMDDLLKEFRDLKISIVKTVNGSASNNSPRKFTCFYCKKEGHRKMDCPEFLKSKQDKEISPVTGSNAIPLNSRPISYIDSIPSVEVYATNGASTSTTNHGGKRRRGDNPTLPANEDTTMREPTAGPSGTVYGQVQPQGSYGVPINPPNNGPPGVFYGVPGGGTPLPGPNPSGVPTKPASEQQMASKKKRVRKPVRYLPITIRKQDIWNTLARADAGLTVSEWLAIDKQAARELVDGLRTLRSRKKKITQDNQNRQTISAAHEGRSARGTKRNVQLINTVTNPYGSTVDTTHDSSSTGNSNDIYGVDNSGTNYANDSDESDSWMDSGYTTDSDAPENESDDGSTESLVTEATDETSKYSTVDYPYNLQHMRMSAPLKAPVAVNGIVFECTFDSGASVSVMNEGLARKLGCRIYPINT
ncbi:hypothetical protein G6F70_009217 [Rhizopus microsporus]|nr:hypothetical protein G6F71_009207 [Rhizopus microsporus]KAG1192390.1 hypothetical protein G6F70_009217 [Rhizopus microsporus]KAG1205898.1 hypothetical protein G6F69_009204 [Rhizopus microsporus]KAG1225783.1 hypothetical protein G6F67_009208 [Rhizopus microsporus]KAG1257052.1 hypothetical protein G6F68_009499 [Rhizopus microsporus]